MFLLWKLGLSGCYCLISFEWCVSVQRCMSLVDDSTGVCVWAGGWGERVVGGGCMCARGGVDGRKSMVSRGTDFHD